jgi:hypothetical protein
MLLAGDVGGTKTAWAFSVPRHDRLDNRACFAVAGPVVDGRARRTNLPWMPDGLAEELGLASVRIIKDLEAWDSFRYVAHPSTGGHGDSPHDPARDGSAAGSPSPTDRCAILGAVLYDFGSTSTGPPGVFAT